MDKIKSTEIWVKKCYNMHLKVYTNFISVWEVTLLQTRISSNRKLDKRSRLPVPWNSRHNLDIIFWCYAGLMLYNYSVHVGTCLKRSFQKKYGVIRLRLPHTEKPFIMKRQWWPLPEDRLLFNDCLMPGIGPKLFLILFLGFLYIHYVLSKNKKEKNLDTLNLHAKVGIQKGILKGPY